MKIHASSLHCWAGCKRKALMAAKHPVHHPATAAQIVGILVHVGVESGEKEIGKAAGELRREEIRWDRCTPDMVGAVLQARKITETLLTAYPILNSNGAEKERGFSYLHDNITEVRGRMDLWSKEAAVVGEVKTGATGQLGAYYQLGAASLALKYERLPPKRLIAFFCDRNTMIPSEVEINAQDAMRDTIFLLDAIEKCIIEEERATAVYGFGCSRCDYRKSCYMFNMFNNEDLKGGKNEGEQR